MAGMPAPLENPVRAAQPPTPWTGTDLLLTFVAGLVGSAALVYLLWRFILPSSISFQAVTLSEALVYGAFLLAAWIIALRRRGASLGSAGFRPVHLQAVLAMIPLTIAIILLDGFVIRLTDNFFGDVPTAREQLGLGSLKITTGAFVSLLIVGAVIAPAVEELLFRGLLYGYLRSRRGRAFALLISSAVFAALHLIPALMPSLFLFGLVLAVVYERYGSLYPCVVLHALNNAIIFVVLYSVQS
jgi:uncharacterized protein